MEILYIFSAWLLLVGCVVASVWAAHELEKNDRRGKHCRVSEGEPLYMK